MKLTTQQINALSNKIYNDLYKDNKEIYNAAMDSLKAMFEKTKEYKAMQLLKDLLGYNPVNETCVMQKLYNLPKQTKTASENSIRNAIILSTIDCANLDELIEKVKTNVSE
jgi:hypothetical protein